MAGQQNMAAIPLKFALKGLENVLLIVYAQDRGLVDLLVTVRADHQWEDGTKLVHRLSYVGLAYLLELAAVDHPELDHGVPTS